LFNFSAEPLTLRVYIAKSQNSNFKIQQQNLLCGPVSGTPGRSVGDIPSTSADLGLNCCHLHLLYEWTNHVDSKVYAFRLGLKFKHRHLFEYAGIIFDVHDNNKGS